MAKDIFQEAKNFQGNKELFSAIELYKKNMNKKNQLAIMKELITEDIVGIIPVQIEGGITENKKTCEEKEIAYIENYDKTSGGSLKIIDYLTDNVQFCVLYTDFKHVNQATKNLYKEYSWITISGLDLIYLSSLDDIFGILVNPYTDTALALRNFQYREFMSLPRFNYGFE